MPASGCALAGQQPQQRRLARAVDADDADPVARAEPPGHVVEQHRGRRPRRVTSSSVETFLPSRRVGEAAAARRVARRRLVGDQRVGRVDAELAACDVRAGGPRRSQASSLRSRLLPALLGDRRPSARARPGPARTPRSRPRRRAPRRRRPPRSWSQTASRNHRSWVTTTSAAPARAHQVLGQPGDALDVEVVGRLVEHQQVGRPTSSAASATRRRSPPDSGADRRVQARRPVELPSSRSSTSRTRGVAGPLVLGGVPRPSTTSRTVRPGGERRRPGRARRSRRPPRAGDPAGVRLLRAGRARRSRVVLPPPLRPTTPIRSPAPTPSETSSSTTVVPYALDTRSRLTRFRGRSSGPAVSRSGEEKGGGEEGGRRGGEGGGGWEERRGKGGEKQAGGEGGKGEGGGGRRRGGGGGGRGGEEGSKGREKRRGRERGERKERGEGRGGRGEARSEGGEREGEGKGGEGRGGGEEEGGGRREGGGGGRRGGGGGGGGRGEGGRGEGREEGGEGGGEGGRGGRGDGGEEGGQGEGGAPRGRSPKPSPRTEPRPQVPASREGGGQRGAATPAG